jgi:hypothetical protein
VWPAKNTQVLNNGNAINFSNPHHDTFSGHIPIANTAKEASLRLPE